MAFFPSITAYSPLPSYRLRLAHPVSHPKRISLLFLFFFPRTHLLQGRAEEEKRKRVFFLIHREDRTERERRSRASRKKKKKSSFRTTNNASTRFSIPLERERERARRGISLFFVSSRCDGSIEESRLNEPLPSSFPSSLVATCGSKRRTRPPDSVAQRNSVRREIGRVKSLIRENGVLSRARTHVLLPTNPPRQVSKGNLLTHLPSDCTVYVTCHSIRTFCYRAVRPISLSIPGHRARTIKFPFPVPAKTRFD